MARIIVNPDTDQAWESALAVGITTLGSGEENTIAISHPSVSAAHCQIDLSDKGALLTDLGSERGTNVDDFPVKETVLKSGQTVRIGDVLFRFDAGAPDSAPPAPSVTPVPLSAKEANCRNHPRVRARYACQKCHVTLCDFCVPIRSVRGAPQNHCPICGSPCVPLSQPKMRVAAPRRQSFYRLVPGAFAYPFCGDGAFILAGGTVFLVLVDTLARFAGIVGFVLLVCGTGYLVAYYQQVLQSSAVGEDKIPDWPDFSNLGELVPPLVKVLLTVLGCFLPAILVHSLAPRDAPWYTAAAIAAQGFGVLYLPMALTAVAMSDSLRAMNPLVVIGSICKIPLDYGIAVVVSVAIYFISMAGNEALSHAMSVPFVPAIISELLGLYLGLVEMRLLGLMYFACKDDLGWYSHRRL